MPKRLTGLTVNRGSLVDVPAAKNARVLLFKRDEIAKKIVEENGKFVVYSEDGKKKLGTYDTKAEAVERLRQIEGHKPKPFGKQDDAPMPLAYEENVIDPATFAETWTDQQAQKLLDEASEMYRAFWCSLTSIVESDTETSEKGALLKQSFSEFSTAFSSVVDEWLSGSNSAAAEKIGRKVSASRMKRLADAMRAMKQAIPHLKAVLADGVVPSSKKNDKEQNMPKIDKSKLDAATVAYIEELEKKIAPPPTPEDVLKGLSPEVRLVVEKAQSDAAAAIAQSKETEAILKREREERRTKEFIAKAATLRGLPIKADELAPILKGAADELPQAEYDKLEGLLKAASTSLEQSAAFKAHGSDEATPITAEGKLEALAKARVETLAKGGQVVPYAVAYDAVWQENPELRKQYDEERATKH